MEHCAWLSSDDDGTWEIWGEDGRCKAKGLTEAQAKAWKPKKAKPSTPTLPVSGFADIL